jgi:hypothetical protein
MNILDDIAIKYNTDKSSIFHNYTYIYDFYFSKIRHEKLKICEIGVLNGASLKTWTEYFENSIVVGIDVDLECKKYESDRVFVEIGNQTDFYFLEEIKNKYKGFDIIIDDGGHTWFQQKTTFEFLKHCLNPSGFYIIEDLSTSYLKNSVWDTNEESTVEYLKRIIDDVNLNGKCIVGTHGSETKSLNWAESHVEYITFYKGVSILNMRKKSL